MNSHVSYLKSGPQCLGRKKFNAEKETILIPARVKKPQYKRKEAGVCKVKKYIQRNPITEEKKAEEADKRQTKGTEAKASNWDKDAFAYLVEGERQRVGLLEILV